MEPRRPYASAQLESTHTLSTQPDADLGTYICLSKEPTQTCNRASTNATVITILKKQALCLLESLLGHLKAASDESEVDIDDVFSSDGYVYSVYSQIAKLKYTSSA